MPQVGNNVKKQLVAVRFTRHALVLVLLFLSYYQVEWKKKNLALMMQMIDHIFIVELIHLELVTLRLINPVIQLSFLIFISMYSL